MPPATITSRSEVLPTSADQLELLSNFLCEGLQISKENAASFTADALGWKYFKPRDTRSGPRSFIVQEARNISAHVGVITTAFVSPGNPGFVVNSVYPVDWVSARTGGVLGAMLMFKAFGVAEVQYSLGSTETGQKVLAGCGFREIAEVPIFYRFFKPLKRSVWGLIHGRQKFPKNAAMFAIDMGRSVLRRRKRSRLPVELRRVERFGNEISDLFYSCPGHFICTSRSPELLNYYLSNPSGIFTGWLIERQGRLLGFALTSILNRGAIRMGNVVDVFLAENDAALWQSAVERLSGELKAAGSDVARAMCSARWMQCAMRDNGYFQRGRGTFFLRDPKKLVPLDQPFHLTLIDGDSAC